MSTAARSFQDLLVWKKAHQFVLEVYKLTGEFPKAELYGLTTQFRRAAVSVPANIAEGFKKRGRADKVRFYNIAQGSLEECRYYLILANDLGYYDSTGTIKKVEDLSKLLESFINSIKNQSRILTTDPKESQHKQNTARKFRPTKADYRP